MAFATKKNKRGGEASLFNEQTGRLTEQSIQVCKFCGINENNLYPK